MDKVYKLVSIEWADAQSDCEWGSLEKIKKWVENDCIILEIGWLVHETKDYIVVSNQVGKDDGEFGNRTKIPKGWIRKRKKLEIK